MNFNMRKIGHSQVRQWAGACCAADVTQQVWLLHAMLGKQPQQHTELPGETARVANQ